MASLKEQKSVKQLGNKTCKRWLIEELRELNDLPPAALVLAINAESPSINVEYGFLSLYALVCVACSPATFLHTICTNLSTMLNSHRIP